MDLTKRKEVRKDSKHRGKKGSDGRFQEQDILARLGTSLEWFPEPTLIYNSAGIIVLANDPARTSLGIDPVNLSHDDVISRLSIRFGNGKDLNRGKSLSARALRGEVVRGVIHTFVNARGEERAVLGSAAPIELGGKIAGAVVQWKDITPLRRETSDIKESYHGLKSVLHEKKEKLAKTDKLLDQILSNSQILITYLNNELHYVRVNKAYADYFGKHPEFFSDKKHNELNPNYDIETVLYDALKSGDSYYFYGKQFFQTPHSVPSRVLWDWSIHPVRDKSGKVEGIVVMLIDATERIRLEKEKHRQLKKLKEVKRLADIGMLSATVAHEFRNPLGVIRTAAYNIRKKAENPSLERHLINIERKVEESTQIINNLLNFAHLKDPSYELVPIRQLLVDCIEGVRRRYRKKEITIRRNLRSIGRTTIEGDSIQLKEIFNNILNNAFDAINEVSGKVVVRSRVEDKRVVSIIVEDNGPGMAEGVLERVFDPFYTTRAKGTGLGLSIGQEMVRRHGGEIDIKSEMGKGTTVIVQLPLKREYRD